MPSCAISGVALARDVLAVEVDAAARGLPQAHDGAQRGGLAGAVAAQEHRQLPARHLEIDAVQDVVGADVGMHAFQLQQRAGVVHAASSTGARPRYACCTTGEEITCSGSPSAIKRAVVQHDDAVRQLAHHVHLVLDQQDGLAGLRLQSADQVEDHRHFIDAHAGGRFVEHVDLRVERHQQADLQLALVAVRQRCRRRHRAWQSAPPSPAPVRRARSGRGDGSRRATDRARAGAATAAPAARFPAPSGAGTGW